MINPKVLAVGKFRTEDLVVSLSESNRQIDLHFEDKIDSLWKGKLEKAKEDGKVCYNGVQYRLNYLNKKDNKLFLNFGTIEFKVVTGLVTIPEYFDLAEDYYVKQSYNHSTVKTSDDRYFMVELSGKSMNTNTLDFIGGLMEKPMEMSTNDDVFKSMYIELEEEANIIPVDIENIYLRSIYLGTMTGVGFYFETTLNISSMELIDKFNKENMDQDIKSLKSFSREEYISQLKNHKSKNKHLIAELVNI